MSNRSNVIVLIFIPLLLATIILLILPGEIRSLEFVGWFKIEGTGAVVTFLALFLTFFIIFYMVFSKKVKRSRESEILVTHIQKEILIKHSENILKYCVEPLTSIHVIRHLPPSVFCPSRWHIVMNNEQYMFPDEDWWGNISTRHRFDTDDTKNDLRLLMFKNFKEHLQHKSYHALNQCLSELSSVVDRNNKEFDAIVGIIKKDIKIPYGRFGINYSNIVGFVYIVHHLHRKPDLLLRRTHKDWAVFIHYKEENPNQFFEILNSPEKIELQLIENILDDLISKENVVNHIKSGWGRTEIDKALFKLKNELTPLREHIQNGGILDGDCDFERKRLTKP